MASAKKDMTLANKDMPLPMKNMKANLGLKGGLHNLPECDALPGVSDDGLTRVVNHPILRQRG